MTGKHQRRAQVLDWIFRIGLLFKGVDGVLEIIGGVLFLLFNPDQLDSLVRILTQHELSEDPGDLIANLLLHASGSLTISGAWFLAAYLLLHGIVKVALVCAVLLDQLWAFPWMIAFLLIFIGYQSYELIVGFGMGMLALTLFDVFIVWLTMRKYRIQRRHRQNHGNVGV
ncbi:DUF2127 domain-containing protein [Glutamicibacter soli]|uniref:DUF2127 domain-containing protein n=1 Tax=Glutamicibacter soli TaxID=453836 RepID=UPI003C7545F7